MTVFDKGVITVIAVEVLFAIVAIPLVLRKVPPNRVYGYRTPSTLSDERIWYAANAHFGRGMLVACVVSIVAILVLYRAQVLSPRAFLDTSLIVLVVPTLIAALVTARYIHRLRA